MAKASFFLVILSLIILLGLVSTVEPAGHRRSRARAYVEAQCQSTLYPELCVKCLLPYVNSTNVPNPQQLARISLMVTLTKARFTKGYVTMVAKQFNNTKAGDYQGVQDCLDQINDGVEQITHSIKELQRMGQDGEEQFVWHESNVQSWVTAAFSDATTCINGISGNAVSSKVKATIKAKVLNVAQLTSNSLALFNRFTARHRASHAIKNP